MELSSSSCQRFVYVIQLIYVLLTFCPASSFIIRSNHILRTFPLHAAGDLPSALEWLAEENDLNLKWIDPASPLSIGKGRTADVSNAECKSKANNFIRMPLYPLEACYLPIDQKSAKENDYSFIRSVEPRNLQMACDLRQSMERENGDGIARFCAVLKANDTGRIATVGTMMRVIEFDEQFMWDGKTLQRVVLKCIPEQPVEISNIVNPKAWSKESRLFRSDEYLLADVEPFISDDSSSSFEVDDNVERILKDYESVKNMYKKCEIISSFDFPQFAIDSLSDLPTMNPIFDEASFWTACNIWQKLCYTIKEATRVNIQSEVDEVTISAAMEKGGPLNLPVHREDLPFDVRFHLDKYENEAARKFIKVGMEPCLQFQNLLATKDLNKKVIILEQMISNELERLKDVQSTS